MKVPLASPTVPGIRRKTMTTALICPQEKQTYYPMSMSKLKNRLQVLIDDHRLSMLEAEAERTRMSVAEVVREGIDMRLAERDAEREAAWARLSTAEPLPVGDWADIKKSFDEELFMPGDFQPGKLRKQGTI
jgi:hypothetical protein